MLHQHLASISRTRTLTSAPSPRYYGSTTSTDDFGTDEHDRESLFSAAPSDSAFSTGDWKSGSYNLWGGGSGGGGGAPGSTAGSGAGDGYG